MMTAPCTFCSFGAVVSGGGAAATSTAGGASVAGAAGSAAAAAGAVAAGRRLGRRRLGRGAAAAAARRPATARRPARLARHGGFGRSNSGRRLGRRRGGRRPQAVRPRQQRAACAVGRCRRLGARPQVACFGRRRGRLRYRDGCRRFGRGIGGRRDRGNVFARLALERHCRAGDHLDAVGVQHIGADDVVADRQVALGLDQETAAVGNPGLAKHDLIGIGANLAAGFGRAGDEDLGAFDLDRLDGDLHLCGRRRGQRGAGCSVAGGVTAATTGRLRLGRGRRRCASSVFAAAASAGGAAASSTLGVGRRRLPAALRGCGAVRSRSPRPAARPWREPARPAFPGSTARLSRATRPQRRRAGGAQGDLVVAGLQRLVEDDREIAFRRGLRAGQHGGTAEHLDQRVGRCLAGNHHGPVGLDAHDVECRHGRACRRRGGIGRRLRRPSCGGVASSAGGVTAAIVGRRFNRRCRAAAPSAMVAWRLCAGQALALWRRRIGRRRRGSRQPPLPSSHKYRDPMPPRRMPSRPPRQYRPPGTEKLLADSPP